MKTTFRLMGIADWITLGNGLLGTLSILFLILAFDGFASVDDSHLSETYIWGAMLFILLSVIGDAIDGPIARRYSKRRHLGSYLDLMSDSLSFGVAPALLVFGMFSRWGEAAPYWTIPLAATCCWIIVCTMLRLARFQHESDDENPWFHGLASPGNALLIVALSGLVWVQPEALGPDMIEWRYGEGDHPALDWLLLPGCLFSGALMISDRRLPKYKKGWKQKMMYVLMLLLLIAIAIQILGYTTGTGTLLSLSLFSISLFIILFHVVMGPTICEKEWGPIQDEPNG
ncbi:MAG: CDP-alcohol phosphatidyltransferase family protein [Candidatus Thalassarchaeaceae archaeon]|nr:CDP-alcohol phosphatidyltransferase family protein [Candidatus Thalassarchaeaceae archaeon]